MKKSGHTILSVLFVFLLAMVSCSGDSDNGLEVIATAPPVTLSGTINTGTISGLGRDGQARALAQNYDVVVIDDESGKAYFGSTDVNGEFSIGVPGNATYVMSLLDDSSSYAGPVVMKDGATSDEAIMGLKPAGDFSFGTIDVDSTLGMAKPATEPEIADADSTAVADNGVPVGANNNGTGGDTEGLGNGEGNDKDLDGVPNYFDSDDDGDGILNGIAEPALTRGLPGLISRQIEDAFLMMNIWARYEDIYLAADFDDHLHMRLTLLPKTTMTKTIDHVQCENPLGTAGAPSGPPGDPTDGLADDAEIWNAGSLGTVATDADYMSFEGDDWNDPIDGLSVHQTGFQLYETTIDSVDQWVVLIIPHTKNLVGRIFKIMVYYTDGTSEGPFPIHIPWVLGDIARVTQFEDGTSGAIAVGTAIIGGSGAVESPATLSNFTTSTTSLTVTWGLPRFPASMGGGVILGLGHSIRIVCAEFNEGLNDSALSDVEIRYDPLDPFCRIIAPTSDTLAIDLQVNTTPATDDLPDTVGGTDVAKYYIVPIAETADGQRNGEEIWLDNPNEASY